MKLNEILNRLMNENSASTYDFGCVMLYFDFPELAELQHQILVDDIYFESGDKTFGLEDEPHCTLLYGLHKTVSVEDVRRVIEGFTYSSCDVHTPSLFKSEKYDVLKFEVDGENIYETNKALIEYPYTNSYSTYNPHLTVAYLQPGRGEKYVEMFNRKKKNKFWLHPQYVVYSTPNGDKHKLNITTD